MKEFKALHVHCSNIPVKLTGCHLKLGCFVFVVNASSTVRMFDQIVYEKQFFSCKMPLEFKIGTTAHFCTLYMNRGTPKYDSCKDLPLWSQNVLRYKKVLLRECKRHTARHVASAHYAGLSHGWGGATPGILPTIQTWLGGGLPQVPSTIQTWSGGRYPRCPHHPDLGWGTPPPSRPGQGVPLVPLPSKPEMGYPPPSRPEIDYPPTQT